jgi:hypothetical protein
MEQHPRLSLRLHHHHHHHLHVFQLKHNEKRPDVVDEKKKRQKYGLQNASPSLMQTEPLGKGFSEISKHIARARSW